MPTCVKYMNANIIYDMHSQMLVLRSRELKL
jgi:hypothetical protein